jgi:hypothetical protein
MNPLDTPISPLRNRTPRELILLAFGVTAIVHDAMFAVNPAWNILGYSIAILAFALQLFPARAIGIGWCISAIILQVSHLQYDNVTVYPYLWIGVVPYAILLLLASRDLVRRYDLAPSRIPGIPNHWAEVPRAHWRASCWTGYALGSMGAMLFYAYLHSRALGAPESWALWVCIGTVATLVLLIAARAIALVAAAALGITTSAMAWPEIAGARTLLDGRWPDEPLSGLFASTPHYAIPLFLLGLATAAIAAPYVGKLFWRVIRG